MFYNLDGVSKEHRRAAKVMAKEEMAATLAGSLLVKLRNDVHCL